MSSTPLPSSPPPPRILIVDDDPQSAKLMTVLLRGEGYVVDTVPDAESALEALDHQAMPNVIFMDIQLPGMDGLELTRRLKSDSKYRHIPVVAFTGHAMTGDDEEVRAAGCDDYAVKPIDIDQVTQLIARLTGKQ